MSKELKKKKRKQFDRVLQTSFTWELSKGLDHGAPSLELLSNSSFGEYFCVMAEIMQ